MLGRCHLITDTRPGRDLLGVLPAALDAGVDVVQVRAKERGDREVLALVETVLGLCAPYGASCVVDDRLDVALAAGAHGVHLGADDLPVAAARRIAGPRLLIGATARDAASGVAAVAAGASYLGVGPAFATTTKQGLPAPIGPAGVAAVAAAVTVPVIAIGGVTLETVGQLLEAGAHGVAVVDAVYGAADPGKAAGELVRALSGAAA
ncbi:MAG TPA: thiamine phosphate synthase [Acidimicrobiales bacterium]|nr:thiamine phosphate synthase [Acidimicrobiales bacterium]